MPIYIKFLSVIILNELLQNYVYFWIHHIVKDMIFVFSLSLLPTYIISRAPFIHLKCFRRYYYYYYPESGAI
jgi:hypothetical protein